MITTELYTGQGFGNQLWCYVVTRVIALDQGYDFGIEHPERFKGADFLHLDFGKEVTGILHHYQEKELRHPINGADIRTYDKALVSVADNTKIDGILQDEQYILHRKNEIREWVKIPEEYECYDFSSDDICIINFRGGEYTRHSELFLPSTYWDNAIANMQKINSNFKFIVITDDPRAAKKFFPDFEVFHFTIAKDYTIIKNAHYLILSNSSFAWFPAWLSQDLTYCIAPKYWARHNISDGYWSCGYNITRGWMYQDREGTLHDYDFCIKQLSEYSIHTILDISKPYSITETIGSTLRKKLLHMVPKSIKMIAKRFLYENKK